MNSYDIWLDATKKEWILIILTFTAATLLNLVFFNRSLGIPILILIVLLAIQSPFAMLVALSASQSVADPVSSPLTIAQVLFFVMAAQMLVSRRASHNKLLKTMIKWTVPYLFFSKILLFLKWGEFQLVSDFDLAIVMAIMSCWYIIRLNERYILGLFCIGLGVATVTTSYWFGRAGFETEGLEITKNLLLQGFAVGRSDGNFMGVCVALSASIFAGLSVCRKLNIANLPVSDRVISIIGIIFLILSIPPMIDSQSRGGVFILIIIFIATLFGVVKFQDAKSVGVILISLFGGAMLFTVFTTTADDIIESLYVMIQFSQEQSDDSILLSRADTWSGSWQEFMSNPLVGTLPENRVSISGFGYDYASHNVWLDFARGTGILGIIWFTLFFFHPITLMYRRNNSADAFVWLLPFLALFLIFMNVSLGNLKCFYFLWALAMGSVNDPVIHVNK